MTTKSEMAFITAQLKETREGDPWFGRNMNELLGEVPPELTFIKLHNQHSVLELLWHLITWREFVIDSLQPRKENAYSDEMDWRVLNHSDKTLWPQGLQRLAQTQATLLQLLPLQDELILEQPVKGKPYNFRKLLHGLIQHDTYHLGQVALLHKQLAAAHH